MKDLAHGGACPECTTNCLLAHRNRKNPSSSVDRFFKVMLGKDFSEFMLVPFNVALEKKWHRYINREACLEDTTGEKYPVKISEVEKDVAFKEGWCKFSSEHHLEEGDFLVFNRFRHVGKLHFIVHVYGKSGEEKAFFQRGHDKNVATMNSNATLLNKVLDTDITSSDRRKSSSSSVNPKPLCSDIHHHSTTTNNIHGECTDGKLLQLDPDPWDPKPFYMFDRDVQFINDKPSLFDLSSFEKPEEHTAVAEVGICNDEAGTMNYAEKIIEPQTDSNLLDTFPLKRRLSSPEPQLKKKQNAAIENTIQYVQENVTPGMKMAVNDGERSSTHVSEMIVCLDKIGSADNIPVQRDVSILKTPSYKEKLDNKMKIDMPGPTSSAQDKRRNLGMKMVVNDGERSSTHLPKMIVCLDKIGSADKTNVQRDVSILKTPSYKEKLDNKKKIDRPRPTSCAQDIKRKVATGEAIKTVKKELDRDKLGGRKFSSAVIDHKCFLLLQSQLPSVLLHGEKLQVIYLRAPDRKVFPVIYQQKSGVGVLTSGWQHFKSMYNLQAGYKCCIELEDASKRIYRFEVISK